MVLSGLSSVLAAASRVCEFPVYLHFALCEIEASLEAELRDNAVAPYFQKASELEL